MPAAKIKKTKAPGRVPELGDPDRKRVLNVLAQRRYRQRRREKVAELEAQVKGTALQSPESCDLLQPQESTEVQFDTVSSSTSSSTLEGGVEQNGEVEVEDVMREVVDLGFPVMEFGETSRDLQLFQDFDLSMLPTPLPSSPSSPSMLSCPSSTPNFPLLSDSANFTIPIFSALRAFSTIASALDVLSHIYNPAYLHTLPPTPHPSLPPNLHPTPAQVAIPHHPILDTLPWPGVREKLICMFALPSVCRPAIAQEDEGDGQSKAVMQIVHDLDDFTHGVRVHGVANGWGMESELVEEAWEVGECFFKNWWWCLDAKVLGIANRRRKERGLGALRIGG